jgi:hypothetical protein
MRRVLVLCVVLVASAWGLFVPSPAAPLPTRSLSVSGTGVAMYPAFDPAITRYAVTTTSATGDSLGVTATTADPAGSVLLNGRLTTSPTTSVSGLAPGDEVSVIYDDADGPTAYSLVFLPAGFPALTATTPTAGPLAPGLVAFTLNTFGWTPLPAFDTIVDRNGVPVYVVPAAQGDLDLKEQPSGEITVSRPTTTAGRTGDALVTLDDQLEEGVRREMVGRTNTDGHDSVRLGDGSTILIGYEQDAGTLLTDATIQKLDPDGTVAFDWDSRAELPLTVAAQPAQGAFNPYWDYAHINSVVSVADGDVIASFRHLSSIYRIATASHDGYEAGDVIWRLGGRDSDFTFEGDPHPGGPCAQHTASELSNGNILVFDNGSNAMCLDDAPGGTTIARNSTRITEYELDTTAGTATLVWSHAPDDKYAFFAGSARRTANGNTLIGWAADKDSLATEVNTAGDVLWDIKTPAVAPQYMTYRAELITGLTDLIRPAVTSGVPDSTVLVVGDTVSPEASCTDRGGSNLQTCVVTGLSGGLLDTTTPGARTWQAVAADGAGNTTTLVRHYTVRSPGRLPDGIIRKTGSTRWRGGDLYGDAASQTVRQVARRRHTVAAVWRVQNDGERVDGFRLVASGGHGRVRVRYLAGGTEVTRAVVAGTYRTPALAPGESTSLRVELTPTRRSRVGAVRTFTLRAVSAGDTTRVDRVATTVTIRR